MTQPPYVPREEPHEPEQPLGSEPEPTQQTESGASASEAAPKAGSDTVPGTEPGASEPQFSSPEAPVAETRPAEAQSQWAAPQQPPAQPPQSPGQPGFPPPPGSFSGGNPAGAQPGGYQQPQAGQYQHPAYEGGYPQTGLMTPALNWARPVSAGRQILAWLIDSVLIWLATMILGLLAFIPVFTGVARSTAVTDRYGNVVSGNFDPLFAGASVSFVLVGVVILLIHGTYWWLLATKGITPAMAMLGQRLVSVETGQPAGWGKAFLRGALIVVGSWLTSGILWLLLWLSPLFDSTTGWFQGWADKMIRAVFIDTRNGRDTANQ